MGRYYSPPGTYEAIRKAVLEDPDLTNAEFRLLAYLATKPEGWIVRPARLARELNRSERWEIKPALKGLADRGFVVTETERDDHGRIRRRQTRLRRDLVVVGTATSMTESDIEVPTCDDAVKPQVSTSMTVYDNVVLPPYREDGKSREDGKGSEDVLSGGPAPPEPPRHVADSVPDVSTDAGYSSSTVEGGGYGDQPVRVVGGSVVLAQPESQDHSRGLAALPPRGRQPVLSAPGNNQKSRRQAEDQHQSQDQDQDQDQAEAERDRQMAALADWMATNPMASLSGSGGMFGAVTVEAA